MKCQAPECDHDIPEPRLKRFPRTKTCSDECVILYKQSCGRDKFWADGHKRKYHTERFREEDESDIPVHKKHLSIWNYTARQLQHLPENRFLQWFKSKEGIPLNATESSGTSNIGVSTRKYPKKVSE